MQDLWNERYSSDSYIYGKAPNEFFKQELEKLNPGKILLIGEGEGRNGVYAAKSGWTVDATDFSENAKAKALKLAEENNVSINYLVKDIADFVPEQNTYDAIGIIFVHFQEELRKKINKQLINALKSGGTIIMEVYDQDQISMNSGGPKEADLLYSLQDIVEDFTDLEFISLSRENIYLNESILHSGYAWVIRFVGRKG